MDRWCENSVVYVVVTGGHYYALKCHFHSFHSSFEEARKIAKQLDNPSAGDYFWTDEITN